MSQNTTDIHGHEILHLVHDAATPFTRATLAEHIQREFGAEARFCTCHGGGMTFDELLAFLLARGKFVERDGKLYTDMSQVCGNGDHHHHD